MDNKEPYMLRDEVDKENNLRDYKFLVQKLKNISESIDLLEKSFIDKET